METIRFHINQRPVELQVDPSTPLLWVIREQLGLTGTKFGCGMALCGACTVHVDGNAARSCVMPVRAAQNKRITTVEGLSPDLSHPVQRAWLEERRSNARLQASLRRLQESFLLGSIANKIGS